MMFCPAVLQTNQLKDMAGHICKKVYNFNCACSIIIVLLVEK